MFAYFYQVCLAIFLLQGISTPFLLLIAGLVWRKQSRQLESLGEELKLARRKELKADELFASLLEGCRNCGR